MLLFFSIVLARKAQNFFGLKTVEEATEIFFAVCLCPTSHHPPFPLPAHFVVSSPQQIYNFAVSLAIVAILFVVTEDNQIAWILIMALGLVLAVLLSVGGLYFVRFYRILWLNDPGSSELESTTPVDSSKSSNKSDQRG
jgi:hypothetical protein